MRSIASWRYTTLSQHRSCPNALVPFCKGASCHEFREWSAARSIEVQMAAGEAHCSPTLRGAAHCRFAHWVQRSQRRPRWKRTVRNQCTWGSRSWSILSPRLWMVRALARTGSSSTPSSSSTSSHADTTPSAKRSVTLPWTAQGIGREVYPALRRGIQCACVGSVHSARAEYVAPWPVYSALSSGAHYACAFTLSWTA